MTLSEAFLLGTDLVSFLQFVLVFLVAYVYIMWPRNLPPGPWGLPVVGNLLQLEEVKGNLLEQLSRWRQQYGDVFCLRLGNRYIVFINSYKLAQKTLVKHADVFASRPSNLYLVQQMAKKSGRGLIFSQREACEQLRCVTLTSLKGLGQRSLEQRVQEEARAIVKVIEDSQGRPMTLKPLLSKFSANIICSVVLGKRFELEDPNLLKLIDLFSKSLAFNSILQPMNFLTFLRFLPATQKTVKNFVDIQMEKADFLSSILGEHQMAFDPADVKSLVDMFLKLRSESTGSDKDLYNESNMRGVILDLLSSGIEPRSTALYWCILHLIAYPDMQKRCQQDVDKVVGKDRRVTMTDLKRLPYIEAFITEIHRKVTIDPLGLPNMASKLGRIEMYDIPQDTLIITNTREIHHNPFDWPQPDVFKPERFLDKEGNFCAPKENFMPFSIGSRNCLGESLASTEIFILLCTLCKTFTFSMGQGQKPDLQGDLEVTYTAKDQPIVARRRDLMETR